MLGDAAKIGHGSIVSWQPHGMSFRVHQPEVFTRTVMSRYFKQTKYKSFLRQLHIYGFHRIAKGRDRGAYIHSMFIRNKKSMSLRMTRQKTKGNNSSSNPTNLYGAGDHPDFYSSESSIDVGNAQYQHRHNLTSALQSDPRMVQAWTTTEESKKGFYFDGLATVCTVTGGIAHHTGSIDHQADDEEKPSLLNRAFLLNQEITCAADAIPSPSNQRIGSEDIIDLSVDWLELHEGDEHDHDGGEGFFAGKRLFHVAESENTINGRFSSLFIVEDEGN
jgi:hypothetical protein